MACKVINRYVSDDTGLYFTLWLISQGEEVLLKALTDPDSLVEVPNILPKLIERAALENFDWKNLYKF